MRSIVHKFITVALLSTMAMASVKLGSTVTVRDQPMADNSTFGNIDQVATKHVHLELNADFYTKKLTGWAKHQMLASDTTNQIQFDSWDLTVITVNAWSLTEGAAALNATNWEIATPNADIGQTLVVILDRETTVGEQIQVEIFYYTSATGQAFSWLNPSQTAGGKLPYLFTQCEDINCRSVAPLQDTPANRITYSADITVPSQLVVKMSANATGTSSQYPGWTTYSFACDITIPSYLIAMAIGDIEYRALGDRVGVLTEPSQMDAVVAELDDLEAFLDGVEAYAGPYIWGVYTILVLPPSFPMGGMENPLLTFASPTIITGDKSQVDVAIHEIAHSWTGNEVTCQNWESFWLNEGWTVFIERKISSQRHGKDFAKVAALLGNQDLIDDMDDYGLDNAFSSIHPVLKGRNPDSSFSTIPYEKGFQFLNYLETLIGEDYFQQFLQFYVGEHSLTSISALEFRGSWEYFVERKMGLSPEEINGILAQVDFERWVNVAELAPVPADFSTTESDEAASLALEYINLAGDSSPPGFADYLDWYSNLQVVFHITLANNFDLLTLDIINRIDADLNCTGTVNPEVRKVWYPIGLALLNPVTYDPAYDWISSMGRSKYLNPVYQSLQDSGQHDLAVQWYDDNEDFYHPVAATTLRGILGIEEVTPSRSIPATAVRLTTW